MRQKTKQEKKPQQQKKAKVRKVAELHTKDRKGGAKVRKVAPMRRLNSTLDRFSMASNDQTLTRKGREANIKNLVKEGQMAPLSGSEFQAAVRRTNKSLPDPKKIARLLCPNASF